MPGCQLLPTRVLAAVGALGAFALVACISVPDESGAGAAGAGAVGGNCPGAEKQCGGKCTDLSTDPAHCGACDWSCGGPSCSAGLCTPETVATGLQINRKVAVDDAGLYWATFDNDGLFIAKKDGTRLAGPTVNFPRDLDADATHVYYVDDKSVFRLKKSGGTPEVVGTGVPPDQIFVDESAVYGFTWDPTPAITKVFRTDKSNNGPMQEIISQSGARIRWLTTDATTLYWTSWDGVVRRSSKTGGPVDSSLKANNSAWGVVVHQGKIYWCTDDTVHSAPVGGNEETLFAGGQNTPRAITAHGDYVFWSTKTSLMMQHVSNPGARAISKLSKEVQAIAVDDTHIYFFEHTAWAAPKGQGYRMRRPAP